MNDIEKLIRDLSKKESLRVIKESQASFLVEESSPLDDTMETVNDIIDTAERKLGSLNNQEASARDKEDFSELKNIKAKQLKYLGQLVKAYTKKLELLMGQEMGLKGELDSVIKNGVNVFKNAELQEFSNDKFKKGWGLQIDTNDSSTKLVKILDDANAYKIMSTDIQGIGTGDLLKIPDMKLGDVVNVELYKQTGVGGRFELVKKISMNNITKIVKNPQ